MQDRATRDTRAVISVSMPGLPPMMAVAMDPLAGQVLTYMTSPALVATSEAEEVLAEWAAEGRDWLALAANGGSCALASYDREGMESRSIAFTLADAKEVMAREDARRVMRQAMRAAAQYWPVWHEYVMRIHGGRRLEPVDVCLVGDNPTTPVGEA